MQYKCTLCAYKINVYVYASGWLVGISNFLRHYSFLPGIFNRMDGE